MAKISGEDGACTFNSTTVNITGWTVEVSSEVIDVTDSASSNGNKEFIPSGWKEWHGTFEGFVETGDTGLTVGAAAATLVLTATSGTTWQGSAIITRKGVALDVVGAEAVKVSYDFQGTGALTLQST